MILGIGVDLVDVADMARRLEGGTLRRAFSAEELAYADARPARRAEILAGRWAAREAFAKALGIGLRAGWRLEQLAVAHDERGRPEFRLGPDFLALLPSHARASLSISHTPTAAIAFVVIEG